MRFKRSQKGPRWTAPQGRGVPTWPQDTEIMIHEGLRLKGDRERVEGILEEIENLSSGQS